jgi:hypothetical protein
MYQRGSFNRRIVALLGVALLSVASLEPVAGSVRDGRVHHESTATAAGHSAFARGDHGHEDVGGTSHERDSDHEHGTSADHCTHAHGAVSVSYVQLPFASSTHAVLSRETFSGTERFTETGSDPPRNQ